MAPHVPAPGGGPRSAQGTAPAPGGATRRLARAGRLPVRGGVYGGEASGHQSLDRPRAGGVGRGERQVRPGRPARGARPLRPRRRGAVARIARLKGSGGAIGPACAARAQRRAEASSGRRHMQAHVNVNGVQTCVPGQVPAQTGNGALPQAGSRLVDVVVLRAVLVVGARVVAVAVPAIVVDVVQLGMGAMIWLSPGSPTAPGPGRSAAPSTVALKVGG